ncbi:MAG: glycosyltransferase family 2 protein [Planctomycetaceae bacterium]
MSEAAEITLVVPTYQREEVLCETLRAVQRLGGWSEVVVVDQTPMHTAATTRHLEQGSDAGWLTWVRREEPSIPRAMNAGMLAAAGEIVLFLDDDIIPDERLVQAHVEAHAEFPEAWGVVGQVLQPGEESHSRGEWKPRSGFLADLDFPFWSNKRAWVSNVMAGNLSVKRERAIGIGGFDENFEGVAYRFETEFARRLLRAGGKILFEPAASLRHLRASRGGTRSEGSHLTSASPRHGMGDYYFALRSGWSTEAGQYMLKRPLREVRTRFHLWHPWYIPVKLIGELRAFVQACELARRGPRLMTTSGDDRTTGKAFNANKQLAEETAG